MARFAGQMMAWRIREFWLWLDAAGCWMLIEVYRGEKRGFAGDAYILNWKKAGSVCKIWVKTGENWGFCPIKPDFESQNGLFRG